ncbi:hypothetical protein COCON_G00134930 [Conger conger]|uniref:Uncharacterized protein n=1 Tax=Conger conger TaxID=82655 RepID=A0A9Q1DEP1_CONCO|nr:hypothetical protein COCON_G00134930 [Conger conger]
MVLLEGSPHYKAGGVGKTINRRRRSVVSEVVVQGFSSGRNVKFSPEERLFSSRLRTSQHGSQRRRNSADCAPRLADLHQSQSRLEVERAADWQSPPLVHQQPSCGESSGLQALVRLQRGTQGLAGGVCWKLCSRGLETAHNKGSSTKHARLVFLLDYEGRRCGCRAPGLKAQRSWTEATQATQGGCSWITVSLLWHSGEPVLPSPAQEFNTVLPPAEKRKAVLRHRSSPQKIFCVRGGEAEFGWWGRQE